VLITVRNTLFAIAATAGLSASAAAQTLADPNTGTDAAAVDIATAASLEAAPPAENLIAPDATDEPTPSVDAEYMAARESLVQDNPTDPDEPPIAGDVSDRTTTGKDVDAGAGQSTAESNFYNPHESVAVDHDGDYIADDWTYDDHTGFAELISSGTWLHRGRWFTQLEATLVFRSTAPRQILSDIPLIFQGQTFFSEAMTTESDGFGYEPGTRVTVGKYLGRDDQNRDRTLEFTFWGLHEWTSQYAVAAINPSNETSLLRTPLDRGIGAYNFATGHQMAYESNLNSFEMNAKISRRLGRDRMVLKPDGRWERQCDPGRTPTFLAGFRAITIDEEFSFDAQRTGFVGNPNLPNAFGTYDIDAQNRMFGLQLGAELIQQHCNWSFGVRGKLGGYVNFVDQTTQVRVSDTRPGLVSSVRDEEASDVQMAMGAELGLVGTYQIRPNIAFRASYDFIYLQGLALAPEQLDFNTASLPEVRSGSHYFLNGGTVGFEFVW
jgi:hypothetical protein